MTAVDDQVKDSELLLHIIESAGAASGESAKRSITSAMRLMFLYGAALIYIFGITADRTSVSVPFFEGTDLPRWPTVYALIVASSAVAYHTVALHAFHQMQRAKRRELCRTTSVTRSLWSTDYPELLAIYESFAKIWPNRPARFIGFVTAWTIRVLAVLPPTFLLFAARWKQGGLSPLAIGAFPVAALFLAASLAVIFYITRNAEWAIRALESR